MKTRDCEYCGKSFELTRKDKRFCRKKCGDRASAKRTGGRKRWNDRYKRPYIIHKKDFCEHCGFIPLHSCQLDVDHIDGDKENNNKTNLQTLCANCHRLKTYLNKDWT